LSFRRAPTARPSECDIKTLPLSSVRRWRSSISRPRSCRLRKAEKLDPKDIVTLEELAIPTMWENAALVELLERKGILSKQEVLAMIQELRQREPTAIPPRRLSS